MFVLAFAALLGVNVVAARHRNDRALIAGLASVAQGLLMVPIAATVAGASPTDVAVPALAVFTYFAGSVLYVKTMIRNRGEKGYFIASVAFHGTALAAALAVILVQPLSGQSE